MNPPFNLANLPLERELPDILQAALGFVLNTLDNIESRKRLSPFEELILVAATAGVLREEPCWHESDFDGSLSPLVAQVMRISVARN